MKKPNLTLILLLSISFLCISTLFVLSFFTYLRIDAVSEEVSASAEDFKLTFDTIQQRRASGTSGQEASEQPLAETSTETTNDSSDTSTQLLKPSASEETPSVFSQQYQDSFSSDAASFTIGIDPGHQSENIDMSATEPIGPGASETKAKATSGTVGSFTKIPEYALNLNVSLLLKEELENRGYNVVMTRTDNETAISNKERAELVASKGADIYVRIHANGDDSASVSGALAICPSVQNHYVSYLYADSLKLSQSILESYCSATSFTNLGIQYRDDMTGINWSSIPVTILEMGFMTNESDDTLMNDVTFQQTMVEGIANGIDAYFSNN